MQKKFYFLKIFFLYFFKALFDKNLFFSLNNCQNRPNGVFAKCTLKPKKSCIKKVKNQTRPYPNDPSLTQNLWFDHKPNQKH
jgi:hypothetical protein